MLPFWFPTSRCPKNLVPRTQMSELCHFSNTTSACATTGIDQSKDPRSVYCRCRSFTALPCYSHDKASLSANKLDQTKLACGPQRGSNTFHRRNQGLGTAASKQQKPPCRCRSVDARTHAREEARRSVGEWGKRTHGGLTSFAFCGLEVHKTHSCPVNES